MILLYVDSLKKKKKNSEKEIRFAVTRGRKWEKEVLEEGDPKVHTSSYEVSKYEGYNVQHEKYG